MTFTTIPFIERPTTWIFLFFSCLGVALILAANTIPEPPKENFEKSKRYHINRILLNVYGGISLFISGISFWVGTNKNVIQHAYGPSMSCLPKSDDIFNDLPS